MEKYRCVVSNENGTITKCIREASSVESLYEEIREEGLYAVSIKEHKQNRAFRKKRATFQTIAELTELLASLLKSGLSVRDSLDILKHITRDKKTISLVSGIEDGLKSGQSFYLSLKNSTDLLPAVYGSLVRVGETTGDLATVFQKLDAYIARRKQLREKLFGSLIYPVIVLIVAFLCVLLIITFIIPSMTTMFTEIGTGIPADVRRILSITHGFFSVIIYSMPLLLISFSVGAVLYRKSTASAHLIDKIKLRLPVLGKFYSYTLFLNSLFTLDALTKSGVNVEDALKEVVSTTVNTAVAASFQRAYMKVMKGAELSSSLSEEQIIPNMITKWIAVGEKTGNMGEAFSQLTDYYENMLEKKTARFMSLIEPALIIFTGLIVFGIVMFIIVPLFSTFGMVLS